MTKHLTTTNLLITLNIAIFSILFFINHHNFAVDGNLLIEYGAINSYMMTSQNEWWRLVSAIFLHLDILHLLINMASLFIIGRIVQQVYPAWIYIIIYFSTAIIGSLLALWSSDYYLLVGASGAIFGLFGLLVGYFIVNKSIPLVSNENAISNFWFIIGVNFLIGFTTPSVSIMSHIGGMIAGFIGGILISKYGKRGAWSYLLLCCCLSLFFIFEIKLQSF